MDFGLHPELARFRDDLRAWLAANTISRNDGEGDAAFLRRWHETLYAGGWVGLSWPSSIGGRDLSPTHEAILNEEIGLAGAPDAPRIGYLGRAILEFGSSEQQQRWIPRLLSGADYWCQGFSEPDAGSDLASLSTRATPDPVGGGYRLTGQKVWTSYADHADLCLVLARTGEPGGRHRGISAFVVDMKSDGVEVRPLRASTGEDEFSEVFFTDVEVPEDRRLGAEGDGWAIAMMTVAYERGAADVGYLSKFGAAIQTLRAMAARGEFDDPTAVEQIGELEVAFSVLSSHVRRRMREREMAPGVPGPEMSVDKVLMTRTDQAIYDTAIRLLGHRSVDGSLPDVWMRRYLYSRAASIYGGAHQVQLNIIAKRVLRLPGGA